MRLGKVSANCTDLPCKSCQLHQMHGDSCNKPRLLQLHPQAAQSYQVSLALLLAGPQQQTLYSLLHPPYKLHMRSSNQHAGVYLDRGVLSSWTHGNVLETTADTMSDSSLLSLLCMVCLLS